MLKYTKENLTGLKIRHKDYKETLGLGLGNYELGVVNDDKITLIYLNGCIITTTQYLIERCLDYIAEGIWIIKNDFIEIY